MSSELPAFLDLAWQKGHSLSLGCQIAPEVQTVAAGVAAGVIAGVATNSCAYMEAEKPTATPQQPAAVVEFPKRLPVPEGFQCINTCGPRPEAAREPAWHRELLYGNVDERKEWDARVDASIKAFEALRQQWREDPKNKNKYDKYQKADARLHALLEARDEWRERVQKEDAAISRQHADDFQPYLEDIEIASKRHGVHKLCMEEFAACEARAKETTELAVSISRINGVEPLALNMEIVPAAARPIVEQYLQFDQKFCDGFPSTAGELIKLKPKWKSVTQNSVRLQRMMQILDARFQQYGAFEAFYAMQELIEFDPQFQAAVPPEIFAVINSDFKRKTKLWWEYVREDVRGLLLTYDTLQAQEDVARRESPPRFFGYERSYQP